MPEAERVKIGLCCLWVFCHEEQQDLMRDFIQIKSENIQQCLCFRRRLLEGARSQGSAGSAEHPQCYVGGSWGNTVSFMPLFSVRQSEMRDQISSLKPEGGFLCHATVARELGITES